MLKVKRSNSQEYEIFIKKNHALELYSLEIKEDSNSVIKVRAMRALRVKKDLEIPADPGLSYPFLLAEKLQPGRLP